MAGDSLYKCPKCGDEITERRREAHEKYWCEAVARDTCSSSEQGSETDDVSQGIRQRKVDKTSASRLEPRCPHDLIISDCAACVDVSQEVDAYNEINDIDDLTESPAQSKKKSRLSFLFLILMFGLPAFSAFLSLRDFLNPLVLQVSSKDAATVQKIFFGGSPWLVYCVKKSTVGGPHFTTLKLAAEELRQSGVSVAEVHCWVPLTTKKGPRTLAKRFGFRDSPPVMMLTTGSGKPQFLNSYDFTPKGLVRQTLQQLRSTSPEAYSSIVVDEDTSSVKRKSGNKRTEGRKDYVGQRPQEEHVEEDDDIAFDAENEEVIDLDR